MPFFFPFKTFNFSSSASFIERLLIFSKKILLSSSFNSLYSFGAYNEKLISFSTSFIERLLIFHHFLLFHSLHLMHRTKIPFFLQKP
ncbi:unnamed protein product, partial [Vitis vinifera]